MKIIQTYNKKKTPYIIAIVIFILILFLWISFPLISNSSWDKSVAGGGGMISKSSDLALLDSEGANAPGSPLTGELIDNPATTLDLQASSLFKMPDNEIKYEEESKEVKEEQKEDHNVTPPDVGGITGGESYVKGKLNKLPSIGTGNPQTMTVGSTHNKFFGQGNVKADFVPLQGNSDIKSGKKNFALIALQKAEKSSVMAQNAKDPDTQRQFATSAFEGNKKVDDFSLNSKDEKEYSKSGIDFAKAETDLKKNDPALNKKKITLPSPKKDEDESAKMEEEIKKMLLQMIIQATVGQVFGAIGQMMAMNMCPECYGKKTTGSN